jgi:phosphoribosylglycinamide formyltransferase-1
MNAKPRILVLASGSATGGGSGFAKMAEESRGRNPVLDATIVGVVSNHGGGGVARRAGELNVPFGYWAGPFDAAGYRSWLDMFEADYTMLSGWLKPVSGLDVARTINIHPGPLPVFGGRGMYGHHVHAAVLAAYHRGEVKQGAVTMHYVTDYAQSLERDPYDTGPVIFRADVEILASDTLEIFRARVKACERAWQSYILNLIVYGDIWLEGDVVQYRGPALRLLEQM